MGRKTKYVTEEEQLCARRERQMRYYWKNRDIIKRKNLKRYYAKQTNDGRVHKKSNQCSW